MHSLARRYIKTAILFLSLGLMLGLWMMIAHEFLRRVPTSYLVSAHTHSILVGFVMMMVLGVALWLFPRPDRIDVRYRPGLAEAAYWLVTVGTVIRTGGEMFRGIVIGPRDLGLPLIIVGGASLQVGGLGLYFYTMWTRIRPTGSQQREARGERF
jgi:heme/copper-type cytochrome/quinol oxidase subunit 1